MPSRLPRLVFVAALLLLLSCVGGEATAQDQAAQAPDVQFPTDQERIGDLRLGQAAPQAMTAVSCPPKKGKEIYEAATGDYVQTWRFPGCGVELKMRSDKRGGAKSVAGITVTPPCTLATARGIRLGDTEKAVVAVYGAFRDQDGVTKKGEQFVAGSIYDGMIFTFAKGKVASIFLGAAAE